jgi:predicted PurR-regulated permease PerM
MTYVPPRTEAVSHLAIAALVLTILLFRLLPAALAGLLLFALIRRISAALKRFAPLASPRFANLAALTLVILGLAGVFALAGMMGFHLAAQPDAMLALMNSMADVLGRLHTSLPAVVQSYVPTSVDEIRAAVVEALKTHSAGLSAAGVEALKGAAQVLLSLVVGSLLAWQSFREPSDYLPLSAALLKRFAHLREAFEKVVFAQVRISLVNTTLTGLYLGVALSLLGIHLPLTKTLIVLTFVAGLIPIIGNLISNTAIVVISLGVSLEAGLISLAFLVAVHKLEYFLNAHIVGRGVQAAAWELILAMLGMEAVFGLPGLVAAPILYAYSKHELKLAGLIGARAPPQDGD